MPSSTRLTGGLGYSIDWKGDECLATVVEATRMGINDITSEMAGIARHEHFLWENDTFQTQESVFQQGARIEGPPLRVWGEWGIRDVPRVEDREFKPSEKYLAQFEAGYVTSRTNPQHTVEQARDLAHGKILSTKDVALFLEFGTVKMDPKPWLYDAWDRKKLELAEAIVMRYREIEASGAPFSLRDQLGRFTSHSVLSSGL